MRKKSFFIVSSLLIAAGVGAFYVYPMLNPVHVDASQAERGNLYLTAKSSGQVVPKELVPVVAPAPAKVVSIAVSLGQEVKKGDVLMDIEIVSTGQGLGPSSSPSAGPSQPGQAPPTIPSPIAPAPATAPQAPQPQPTPNQSPPPPTPSPSPPAEPPATPAPGTSGTYTVQPGDTLSDIARRNGTTVEELARSNGLSNPDLIFPGQQLKTPEGKPPQGGYPNIPPVETARIVSTITSPIDGQVVKLEVRADQLVAPPTPLVILADMTSLFLEILVDQEDLPAIQVGQSSQTILDALPKETAKGKVEEINLMPTTSPLGTSGYPVRVKLDKPPKGIRLGMTGQTEIVTRQLTNVLFVPKRAVLERKGEAYVFTVEDNRVQKTIITLGQKTRDYYEISTGLVEGQLVVVTKLDEVDDGKRVAVDRVSGPK